jgi:integrase-like protein
MGHSRQTDSAATPWQNGYAERLIGSIRRECLDHVVIIGERHLRHVLRSYAHYYNGARTHLSLAKDSPLTRSVQPRGTICPLPILGGLHHHYVRIQFPTGTACKVAPDFFDSILMMRACFDPDLGSSRMVDLSRREGC